MIKSPYPRRTEPPVTTIRRQSMRPHPDAATRKENAMVVRADPTVEGEGVSYDDVMRIIELADARSAEREKLGNNIAAAISRTFASAPASIAPATPAPHSPEQLAAMSGTQLIESALNQSRPARGGVNSSIASQSLSTFQGNAMKSGDYSGLTGIQLIEIGLAQSKPAREPRT